MRSNKRKSNIVSTLRNKFNRCTCTSCEKPKCKFKFENVPNEKVILNMDLIKKPRFILSKKCDYMIAVMDGHSAFLIPVEFKSSSMKVNHIKEQLEGGIRFIQRHCKNKFVCYPVLVSKSISRPESRKLQKIVISYNGKTARIRHVSCNQSVRWDKVNPQP